MIQSRENVSFARESSQPIRIGSEGLRQHLDRDIAIELHIGRAIHLAHPAATDDALDLVMPELVAGR